MSTAAEFSKSIGAKYSDKGSVSARSPKKWAVEIYRKYQPELKSDLTEISTLLNKVFFRTKDEQHILDIARKWANKDKGVQGGTPHIDAFLLGSKLQSYEHRDARTMWVSQKSLLFDGLILKLSDGRLKEFQSLVAQSTSESESGPLVPQLENGWKGMGQQLGLGTYGIVEGLSLGLATTFDDVSTLATKATNAGLGRVGVDYKLDDPWSFAKFVQSNYDQVTPQLRELIGARKEDDLNIFGMNSEQFGKMGGQGIFQLASIELGGAAKATKIGKALIKGGELIQAVTAIDDACTHVSARVISMKEAAKSNNRPEPSTKDYLADTEIEGAIADGIAGLASLGLGMTDGKKLKGSQLNRFFRSLAIAAKAGRATVDAKASIEGIFDRMGALSAKGPISFEDFISDPQIVGELVKVFGAAFSMGAAAYEGVAEHGKQKVFAKRLQPGASDRDMVNRQRLMQSHLPEINRLTKVQRQLEFGAKGMDFASKLGGATSSIFGTFGLGRSHQEAHPDDRRIDYLRDKDFVGSGLESLSSVKGAVGSAFGLAQSKKRLQDPNIPKGKWEKRGEAASDLFQGGLDRFTLHSKAHEATGPKPSNTDRIVEGATHASEISDKYGKFNQMLRGKLGGSPVGNQAWNWADGAIQSAGHWLGGIPGVGQPRTQRSGSGPERDHDPVQLHQRLIHAGGGGFNPDTSVRQRLAPILGFDPANARLHTGPHAMAAAANLGAEAFTIGSDVFFGANRFSPSSREGMGLLAHELTHVGQQTGTMGHRTHFFSHSGGDEMEREAQEVGQFFVSNSHSGHGLEFGNVQVDFDIQNHDSEQEASLDQRLEQISQQAIKLAQSLMDPSQMSSINIDELNVDVTLDLDEMSDHEAALVWAKAILGALPVSRESAAPSEAVQLKKAAPKKGTSAPKSPAAPLPKGYVTMSAEGYGTKGILHPHHPTAGSGVTIGPGYDMKGRKAADIKRDMLGAGLDDSAATILSQGAGLSGAKADKFVTDHKATTITNQQAKDIFNLIYPAYEDKARNKVNALSGDKNRFAHLDPIAQEIATDILYHGVRSDAKKRSMARDNYEILEKLSANDIAAATELAKTIYERRKKGKEGGWDRYKRRYDRLMQIKPSAFPAIPNSAPHLMERDATHSERMYASLGHSRAIQASALNSMPKMQPTAARKLLQRKPISVTPKSVAEMSANDRLLEAGSRAAIYAPGEVGAILRGMFTLTNIALIATIGGIAIALQTNPFGWIFDGIVLGYTIAMVGPEAVNGLIEIGGGIADARSASTEKALDKAAHRIAAGAASAGVNGLMLFFAAKAVKEGPRNVQSGKTSTSSESTVSPKQNTSKVTKPKSTNPSAEKILMQQKDAILKQALEDAYHPQEGYLDKGAYEHLRGVDMTKPVSRNTVNAGETRVQYVYKKGNVGGYATDHGVSPNSLGIEIQGRVAQTIRAKRATDVVRSTARTTAPLKTLPKNALGKGGGPQDFLIDRTAWEVVD